MIRLSALARADLQHIARKIKTDSGKASAERMASRLTAAMRQLERFPDLGKPGREPDTRELWVASSPYIIVYQALPGVIGVDRVLHTRMLWPRPDDEDD